LEKYYYELKITPNLYYELFLDLVSSLTAEAIEEYEQSIIVRSEENLDLIQEGVEAFAKELSNAFETDIQCETSLEQKQNKDWVEEYQKSVQPIEVGSLYICPSWYKDDAPKDKNVIIVDPTLSFGSGHHESTNGCLQFIDKYVKQDDQVCDVGCGSGILALASSAKKAKVDICDTDEVAIKDSLSNFELNNMKVNSQWVGSISQSNLKYDIVIANIVADVLSMIAKDLIQTTKKDGLLILSGIMDQYASKVTKKYDSKCELIDKISKNGWTTFVFKKIED
jgi:ribosomal protein L11 methyltransferase